MADGCPVIPGQQDLDKRNVAAFNVKIDDLVKRHYLGLADAEIAKKIVSGCSSMLESVLGEIDSAIGLLNSQEKTFKNPAARQTDSQRTFHDAISGIKTTAFPALIALKNAFQVSVKDVCDKQYDDPPPRLNDQQKKDFGTILPKSAKSKSEIRTEIDELDTPEKQIKAFTSYLEQAEKSVVSVNKARETIKAGTNDPQHSKGPSYDASNSQIRGEEASRKTALESWDKAKALLLKNKGKPSNADKADALNYLSNAFESHPFIVIPEIYQQKPK